MELSSRRWLNQSTHSSVESSTSPAPRQRRLSMTSVLYKPMMLSASILAQESPAVPTDAARPPRKLCAIAQRQERVPVNIPKEY